MHPEFGRIIQGTTDKEGRELNNSEILDIFTKTYLESVGGIELIDFASSSPTSKDKNVWCKLTYTCSGKEIISEGQGNGPIDACKNALSKECEYSFTIKSYSEHSCGEQSSANAVAYIEIQDSELASYFGVGVDSDITIASIKALFSALNRAFH